MIKAVTIVSVAYNSTYIIENLLLSIPKGTPIVVVDNGSNDLESLKEICSQYNALLIESRSNIGFGAACNLGAENASTEFLFFLNPDCVLQDDTIDELILSARRNPRSPAFNPRIMLDDGQPSFNYKSALLPRSKWMKRGWPETDRKINILSGCALFVRQADFKAIGGFDTNIFLYHEDDDISLRLNDRGPLIFSAKAAISHSVGSSSGRSENIVGFKAWHFGYSRIYAKNKHSMHFSIVSTFISAFCKALLPDMVLVKKTRKKRWSYLRGICSGILHILKNSTLKSFKRNLFLGIWNINRSSVHVFAPHGVLVKIPPYSDTSIRYSLTRQRPYEESEAHLIEAYLERDTNVIELGGCYGVISALIRNKIGPNAHHLIVEANPDLAAICSLNANCQLNSPNTDIVVAAVDYSGKQYVDFLTGTHPHGGHISLGATAQNVVRTQTVTLSKLAMKLPEGPFALICDIEGAEVQLFGKENLVLSKISLLILETHPNLYPEGLTTEHQMLKKIRAAGLQEIDRVSNVLCFKPKKGSRTLRPIAQVDCLTKEVTKEPFA